MSGERQRPATSTRMAVNSSSSGDETELDGSVPSSDRSMSEASTGDVLSSAGATSLRVRFSETLEGELNPAFAHAGIRAELLRVIDPAAALVTLHWGRNYLYAARLELPGAPTVDVVVKQFRNETFKARMRRRQRGSKARLSFEHALRLGQIGVSTPQPIAYLDSHAIDGPCYYVCRHAGQLLEARYLVRALDAGTAEVDYPEIAPEQFYATLGEVAAKMHGAGFWHRDLTSGNVLIDPPLLAARGLPGLQLIDLNRARVHREGKALGRIRRLRDLARMPAPTAVVRRAFLEGYERAHGAKLGVWRAVYGLLRRAFLWKIRSKKGVRGFSRRVRDLVLPRRRPHVHIPPAQEGASSRDKIVWDKLSDQPHQHASRGEKLLVRLRDLPEHVVSFGALGLHWGKIRSRMRELDEQLYGQPAEVSGIGVGLRPGPPRGELVRAIRALGVGDVLLRLHPWQEEHDAEFELAASLAETGVELTFALPQNRDLVNDPKLWRRRVAELASRFAPLGRSFQIGQAPNRSKWGIWRPSEYVDLYRIAAEEIRAQRPDAFLLGPSVIDFEFYATALFANLRRDGLEFDALASLLYVDRRGAPENTQLKLDLVGKLLLLRAIAETSRNCPSGRSWITEVNWPLWQGPHSPAGKDVAVDEETQAGYLVRYYVQALATGLVEKIFWWQLVSKGYGLIDVVGGELVRRPAFAALRQLCSELAGAQALGPVGTVTNDERLFRFAWPDGRQTLVGWTLHGREVDVAIPGHVLQAVDRDGVDLPDAAALRLGPQPRYVRLAPQARPLVAERLDELDGFDVES